MPTLKIALHQLRETPLFSTLAKLLLAYADVAGPFEGFENLGDFDAQPDACRNTKSAARSGRVDRVFIPSALTADHMDLAALRTNVKTGPWKAN